MRRAAILFLGILVVFSTLLFFRSWVAWNLVSVGNEFFGGTATYNLRVADGFYTAALTLDPSVPDAWHQRARIDFLNGNFDGALEKINTQIALHGDSFMASYYIRGLIHGYRKEFGDAEKDFLHFLTWDPDNWAARNDLAWVYFAEGKFASSQEEATRGLLIAPTNPWLLMMRGMSRFNLGDSEGARSDLAAAKQEAGLLAERDWEKAYPGNNPSIAGAGLAALRKTIEDNLARVNR